MMYLTGLKILAPALLDDPAFSSDPRANPLANVYPITPSQARGFPLPSPAPSLPPSPQKKHTANTVLKPVQNNIPRRARMKAFVRRFTTRHNLDRIDELDETDPFGGSYHHDGPYEAIGSNLAHPSLPRMHPSTAHRAHSRRESDSHPFRPSHYHSASRAPSVRGGTGLSLHLEPGQILQHNAIYTSRLSSTATAPLPSQLKSNSIPARSDRHQSLPDPWKHRHHKSSSLGPRHGLHTSQAPPERYLAEYTPDTPSHDHGTTTPCVPHRTERTIIPPPRHESRLHTPSPPRSPHSTPPPSSKSASLKTRAPEYVPLLLSRHKTVHSLDSSCTLNSASTRSSSSVEDNPSGPPRIHHLPKRIVMPSPLQPRPPQPQPQYDFPLAQPPAWQDAYPDDVSLEGAHFEGKPTMYNQEPRLLRKKASAFPANTPIPDHVVMSQDDAVSRTANSPAKTANDTEGTRERTRRRRLSKRKNDI